MRNPVLFDVGRAHSSIDHLTRALSLLSLLTIAMVWFRTGILPASSTGDEVWASESGWWLLHDGVLRRDMHADGIGSALRDCLPPVPALGQALAFWLLGLSQFSMGVCSSIAFTAIMALGYLLARQFGLTKNQSVITTFALAFTPAAASQILRVRYEVYVVMFVVLSLYLLNLTGPGRDADARRPRSASYVRWTAAGMAFGAACEAYFGAALGLGLCFLALLGAHCIRTRSLALAMCFCAGAFVVFAAYGAFILGDTGLFLTQMRASAAAYRGAPLRLTMQSALPLGFALLLAAGVVRFIREGFASTQQAVNSVFIPLAAAAMLFWCMSDYYAPRYTLLATTFTSLALGALIATRRQRGGTYTRLLEFLSIALYLSSMSFVLGAAVTAVKQRGDRNYATAAADIVREANLEGLVLTESAGWLALRPLTRRGQLHHLLPKVGDPSDLNSSTLLSDPGRGGDISTVVVLPGHIAAFRKLYPAVNAFMEQPDTVGPLEVDAASSTYHMQMYVRRRL